MHSDCATEEHCNAWVVLAQGSCSARLHGPLTASSWPVLSLGGKDLMVSVPSSSH